MVTSMRFEASADAPEDVRAYFTALIARCGLVPDEITDEVYERNDSGYYVGRMKLVFKTPQNAEESIRWFAESRQAVASFNWSLVGGTLTGENDDWMGPTMVTFTADPLTKSTSDPSVESILDHIRAMSNVTDVEVGYDRMQRDGSGWRVNVTFAPEPGTMPSTYSVGGETLREAATDAYIHCLGSADCVPFEVTMNIAHLNWTVLNHALADREYRTLVVHDEAALRVAREAVEELAEHSDNGTENLSLRIDPEMDAGLWLLTEKRIDGSGQSGWERIAGVS